MRVCARTPAHGAGAGDSLHLPAHAANPNNRSFGGFAGFAENGDLPHGGLILAAVGVAGQPGPYRPRALSAVVASFLCPSSDEWP